MVGKGDSSSSRIFHQCYVKCCKLQNLAPLTALNPSANGKVLDFCVDRIKYVDWPPILNAISCDLSLHSVSIRCRQQVKTEHIDCERLAKTVNKRAVILTNFMLSNLIEAINQMLSNTTLLTSLLLEGLPLKIPYLNPLCEALLANNSLQHLYLPRCLLGDAGCLAICKAVRCMPNMLTLDLTGCELTLTGATHIADLLKYQKIHRYSENWVHTLRYRLPDMDSMWGLRRITLCNNPQLTDAGVTKIMDVLADDLWIKALDVQNCGLSNHSVAQAMQMLQSNTTLVVLDMRHNQDVSSEWLSKLRAGLRQNEKDKEINAQFSWLSGSSNDGRSVKSIAPKNSRERISSNTRASQKMYSKTLSSVKKEKDYTETLEEQLREEMEHRQQLEELNLQLVNQMKQLKQQQIRMWTKGQNITTSSGSEQSVQASYRSCDLSSSSGSSSSVPIDQNTLSYIQQAFKDIYSFIKDNQCHGQCLLDQKSKEVEKPTVEETTEEVEATEMRIDIVPKKALPSHMKFSKNSKSAHMLGDSQLRDIDMKPEMIERRMGDSKNAHGDDQIICEELIAAQTKSNKKINNVYEKASSYSSSVSDSSETLVCSERSLVTVNPREAFYSSSDDDSS